MSQIRIFPVSEVTQSAWSKYEDLELHAEMLARVASELSPKHHALGLEVMGSDWRIYGFERNRSRWPDGRWHMLDRSYEHWRGHCFSLASEELAALGLERWTRSMGAKKGSSFIPMADDRFVANPRRRLKRYAELVARIAEFCCRNNGGRPMTHIPSAGTELPA